MGHADQKMWERTTPNKNLMRTRSNHEELLVGKNDEGDQFVWFETIKTKQVLAGRSIAIKPGSGW